MEERKTVNSGQTKVLVDSTNCSKVRYEVGFLQATIQPAVPTGIQGYFVYNELQESDTA